MRPRWVLAILGAFLLLAGTLVAFHKPEPTYQGLTLSQWIQAGSTNSQPTAALDAVRAIGKAAAPLLAKTFLQRDNFFWRRYTRCYLMSSPSLRSVLPRPSDHLGRRIFASRALAALGSNAVEMLPLIVKSTDEIAGSRGRLIYVLAASAPETSFASNAVEILIEHTKSSDIGVRESAYRALASFTSRPKQALPVLVRQGLVNAQPSSAARDALGRFRRKDIVQALVETTNMEHGANAVEVLAGHARGKDQYLRRLSCEALASFTNRLDVAIPTLITCLTTSSQAASEALVRFGKPAVPALIEATQADHGHLRPAEATLERIDLEAAEKTKAERRALEEQ